jgi:hypothetical protein
MQTAMAQLCKQPALTLANAGSSALLDEVNAQSCLCNVQHARKLLGSALARDTLCAKPQETCIGSINSACHSNVRWTAAPRPFAHER